MNQVSFIIPAYQVEQYIGQCIESILGQTRDNWEAIIIDDGSSDGTYKIAKEYEKKDKRIRVVHKKNGGVSSARNLGIELSHGKWICFIDGDDAIDKKLLETYEQYLNDDMDICFISHKEVSNKKFRDFAMNIRKRETIEFFAKDFEKFKLGIFNRDIPGEYDYHKVKLATPIKFYRKSIVIKNNIRFPENIVTGEDAVFNLRFYDLASHGIFIDLPLYYHRIWNHSVSQRYNPKVESDFEELHIELKKFIDSSSDKEIYLKYYNERLIWSLGFMCILKYCHCDNPESYFNRKKDFLDTYFKYNHCFKYINFKDFRFLKRCFFYLIKYKQFFYLDLITKIMNTSRSK